MAPRRGNKWLALSVFLAIAFFVACAILFVLVSLGVVDLHADKEDYAQNELVLNRFSEKEFWRPICLSPDGKQLVAGGFRKLTWVTNWEDRERATVEIQDLEFGELVKAAAFSNDGSRFAIYTETPAEATIAVLDAQNKQVLKKWPTARSHYDIRIVFSDGGDVLFTNPAERANQLEDLSAITAWEISTGKLLASIRTPKEMYLGDFCFSKGRLLIAYEDTNDYKQIMICESERPYADKKIVASIKAPGPTSFNSVRFSADGTRLAVSCHHAQPMKVYGVSDGHLVAELEKAHYGVSSDGYPGFAFSKSGTLLAVSNSGGSVTFWNVDSSKELGTLEGHRYNPIVDLIFSPDGKTLIGRDYSAVVVWDISGFVTQDR